MAKAPLGSLISVMQNCFFTTSTTLPAPSKKSNLPAPPPLKPPPSCAVKSSGEVALKPATPLTKRIGDQEVEAFFNLFRDYGFEDPQIQKLIECRIVLLDARILKPKLDCLVENGFTGALLHNLIVSSPYILLGSLDSCIKPRFQLLKQYLDSDEKVRTVINRSAWIFTVDLKLSFMPNIEFLINEGVPVDRVSHFLLLQPRAFLQSRDRMAYAFKTVRESGAEPDDPMFIHSLRAIIGLSESSLKKKLEYFKSLGLSDEQTLDILKTYPTCLGLSEEKLRRKIGFLINTIKLDPKIVIHNLHMLSYSEERIRARYEVLKVLNSKKLIRDIRITSVTPFSEDRFVKTYVIEYAENVPGILDMYYGILNERKKKKDKKTET